jgi:hypothetical protein
LVGELPALDSFLPAVDVAVLELAFPAAAAAAPPPSAPEIEKGAGPFPSIFTTTSRRSPGSDNSSDRDSDLAEP